MNHQSRWNDRNQSPKHAPGAPGEDLTYLADYLDKNLQDITLSTLFDVSAVAGDVAAAGLRLRTWALMLEALEAIQHALTVPWDHAERRSASDKVRIAILAAKGQ